VGGGALPRLGRHHGPRLGASRHDTAVAIKTISISDRCWGPGCSLGRDDRRPVSATRRRPRCERADEVRGRWTGAPYGAGPTSRLHEVTADPTEATAGRGDHAAPSIAPHIGKIDAITAAAPEWRRSSTCRRRRRSEPRPRTVLRVARPVMSGGTPEERAGPRSIPVVARTGAYLAATRVAIVHPLVVQRCCHDSTTRRSWTPGHGGTSLASAASGAIVAGLLRPHRGPQPPIQALRRSRDRQKTFVREFKRAGGSRGRSDAANQLTVPGLRGTRSSACSALQALTPVEAHHRRDRKGAELLRADSSVASPRVRSRTSSCSTPNPAAEHRGTRRIDWSCSGRIRIPIR